MIYFPGLGLISAEVMGFRRVDIRKGLFIINFYGMGFLRLLRKKARKLNNNRRVGVGFDGLVNVGYNYGFYNLSCF